MKSCPHCSGLPGRNRDTCLTCWGTGKVEDDDKKQKEKMETRYNWMSPNHVWKEHKPS